MWSSRKPPHCGSHFPHSLRIRFPSLWMSPIFYIARNLNSTSDDVSIISYYGQHQQYFLHYRYQLRAHFLHSLSFHRTCLALWFLRFGARIGPPPVSLLLGGEHAVNDFNICPVGGLVQLFLRADLRFAIYIAVTLDCNEASPFRSSIRQLIILGFYSCRFWLDIWIYLFHVIPEFCNARISNILSRSKANLISENCLAKSPNVLPCYLLERVFAVFLNSSEAPESLAKSCLATLSCSVRTLLELTALARPT